VNRNPAPTRRRHRLRPRRAWAAVAVAVALPAGLLAACGSPPSTGTEGGRDASGKTNDLPDCPLDALKKAKGKVEVEMWFGGLVDPPVTVLNEMVDAFNKSQDKVEVSADNQGTAYAEVLRKYNGAAGTPKQLPDVIYLEDTMLGEMVDKGQVLPAQACMEADGYDIEQITPAVRAAYEVDGVLYPGYMNVSSPVLYYNKVHFQKAGLDPNRPPETLAEMAEAARVIKEKGVAPKPISFIANEWFLNTWMTGLGQEVVNNDNGRQKPPTKATFNTPEVVGALEELASWRKEGLVNPFPVTDGKIDHYLALVSEQSSMLIETSTASGTIAAALGGELTAEDAGIDVGDIAIDTQKILPGAGPMPGIEAGGKVYASGGAFFILNQGSPEQQAGAWEFLKFMLKPENNKKWHIEGGYLPFIKEIIDDPDIREFQRSDLAGNLLEPAVDQLAAADPDSASPLIGPYRDYQSELRTVLEGILFDGNDPKKALKTAEDNVDEILKDYNG
jgi:sn-glycerol 3-phosphate transport system substrate-binding protein